jgi:hypothetical protein
MKCGGSEAKPLQSTIEQFDREQQRRQRKGVEFGSGPVLDDGFYGWAMTSIPSGVVWRRYLRVLADIGFDVASVGAWVAAAELPPARRRLARASLAAVTVAVAIPGTRVGRSVAGDTAEASAPPAGSGLPFVDVGIRLPVDEPPAADVSPRRRAVPAGAKGAAVLTTAVAVSIGAAAAGHHLQRRWLARLTRHGHAHPHRALGVRTAALYAVMVVPSRLLAVREDTKADRRDTQSTTRDGTTDPG